MFPIAQILAEDAHLGKGPMSIFGVTTHLLGMKEVATRQKRFFAEDAHLNDGAQFRSHTQEASRRADKKGRRRESKMVMLSPNFATTRLRRRGALPAVLSGLAFTWDRVRANKGALCGG